ncbi:hypothetical protein IFM89_016375, partial [Coptis chinensis]
AFRVHGEIEEGAVIISLTKLQANHADMGRLAVCNLACEGLSNATITPDHAQRKLHIGGLSSDITSEILLDVFRKHGDIEEGSVAYDKDTNKSRGGTSL